MPAPQPNWWETAFPDIPAPSQLYGHPPGKKRMLTIIAYDIAHPKRLKKIADTCKDYGARAQYSVFECHLEADQLDRLWQRLTTIANPEEDRLVAYPIHGAHADKIRAYGKTMTCNEKPVSYIF